MINSETYALLCRAYEKEVRGELSKSKGVGVFKARPALKALRDYLDLSGYRMPKPLYPFDVNDQNTWRYKDGVSRYCEKTKRWKYKERHNPDFKYLHLI